MSNCTFCGAYLSGGPVRCPACDALLKVPREDAESTKAAPMHWGKELIAIALWLCSAFVATVCGLLSVSGVIINVFLWVTGGCLLLMAVFAMKGRERLVYVFAVAPVPVSFGLVALLAAAGLIKN